MDSVLDSLVAAILHLYALKCALYWQVAAAHNLMEKTRKTVEGRAKLGIEAFAQALLGIPKILAENSGL